MRRLPFFLAIGVLLGLAGAAAGCGAPPPPPVESTDPGLVDPHSFANLREARIRHMALDWTVDFDRQVLAGSAELHLQRVQPELDGELVLDTRDLAVERVTGEVEDGWRDLPWGLEVGDFRGQPLTVQLPGGVERVRVHYATTPGATGLQWLAPEQTAGGTHPFLYSQAQAFHARSFVPCQDSPGVRFTFEATVRVPEGITAVMAAARGEDDDAGAARFEMPNPIPSYLLAIAAGRLEFAEVGPRTGVWAEPPLLAAAADEFADLERMLAATEELYGPYRWIRYDLLVLPPAFPFGGMENPMVTFLTPTVIAGDRSLVSLVAHELAHSWSGNLVTNADWNHFWLNEGFTSYIEKRIMEAVYGAERADMEWILSREELIEEVADLADAPEDQRLVLDLAGRDPDDGMTGIAYDKGALLLRRLEEKHGREVFDPFLRAWFDGHAFTSVTTDMFVDFVHDRLGQEPWMDEWLHAPGLPDDAPTFTSTALRRVDAALTAFNSGGPAAAVPASSWTTQEWLHFLNGLPADMDAGRMANLDEAFGLTASGNSEILAEWMTRSIRAGYHGVDQRLEEFLLTVGRRKFLEPLYEALMATPEGAVRAREIYARARPLYHPIAQRTLDEIIRP